MIENEKNKTETPQEEKSDSGTDSNRGDQPETTPVIERANQAAKELRTENDRKEGLLKKEEQLQARRSLGGESSGLQSEPKSPEETAQEIKDKAVKLIFDK